MLRYNGRIIPAAPKISEIPMKRINESDKPSTPVCPIATNFFLEKIDLEMPEIINVKAVSD